MLTVICATSALISAFFIGRYFAAKKRLAEKAIEEVIAKKLATSPVILEIGSLKEENGVMRNLLIDMVENEASLAKAAEMTEAQRSRAITARTRRRRELFGEALLAIRKTGPSSKWERHVKIDS